jgi:hypothetical protein
MKRTIAQVGRIAFVVCGLFATFSAFAKDKYPTKPVHFETVKAVVADLSKNLDAANKKKLAVMKEDELILLHHGFGTGIRNHYGLWKGNDALRRDACGECHPDDASMVIIKALWRSLQRP